MLGILDKVLRPETNERGHGELRCVAGIDMKVYCIWQLHNVDVLGIQD